MSTVDHPAHYGGEDNPYEAIKVIRAWGLNFSLGNAVKYICRAGKKGAITHVEDLRLEDLKKARWYLDEEIKSLEAMLPSVRPATYSISQSQERAEARVGEPSQVHEGPVQPGWHDRSRT